MERLVDPLTTIDAKLWADEFMKVRARLGEQEFDHAVMLGWFANAIMQGYDEGQRRAKADAQATVEALQRELEHAKKMEAVQKEVADNQTWHVRELRAALDDERDRLAELVRQAQPHVCSLLCPSVKARHELWTHTKLCLNMQAVLTPAKGVQQHPAFDEYGEHRQPTGLGDL